MTAGEMYRRNATAMWSALVAGARTDDRMLIADRLGSTRVILRQPATAQTAAQIGRLAPEQTVVVEDLFDGPPVPAAAIMRMPVMVRPPGAVAAPSVPVTEVADLDQLAGAERVMVDGFPFPRLQPWVRGQALPPRVLELPGWRVWLAHVGGEPAAACYTYDDGEATGVYWMATLGAYRSRGLGRAVLTAAVAARPQQPFTLVATEAGQAMYESCGFITVATATWHTRAPLSGPVRA